ncbi:hypothetical protein J3Q64DRAFT_1120363 [Phycomyces blakesleeanus]|uniref:GST N-terminal domain-containing protein n=2 Tax=Phycomyces blakesleeanus TaxID=4837 RepID=A0A167P4B9_PHYB8|nr:hypothetical protein PHYBLDRAFT_165712 [Phycomyces blakesleeanus NRRL 1555(-)]OAD77224.1 hypothetical protein PHYBLDRAFT_165712 [Phycomyces blakesleeanus NRRL 1555(-)]|eukprot:XP_018295264.1 hypothetical protein PHYBLDRAFT_165712 [Phycomyces blakesleeanus NRRL 1555(-)]
MPITYKLYVFKLSLWAAVPRLLIAERGLEGIQEIEIDLSKGENYSPEFLAINPHATVPTLEVFRDGVRTDVLTDSISVSEYLNKLSGPKTEVPRPTDQGSKLLQRMHGEADVGNPLFFTSGTREELEFKKSIVVPFLEGRVEAWQEYRTQAPEHGQLYDHNIAQTQQLIGFYNGHADPSPLFAMNANQWKLGAEFLDTVESGLGNQGEYLEGPSYSLVDVHFTPYLFRLVAVKNELVFENRPKLKAYYDRIQARDSFSIFH